VIDRPHSPHTLAPETQSRHSSQATEGPRTYGKVTSLTFGAAWQTAGDRADASLRICDEALAGRRNL